MTRLGRGLAPDPGVFFYCWLSAAFPSGVKRKRDSLAVAPENPKHRPELIGPWIQRYRIEGPLHLTS
jgi:hypothetical protein